MRIVPTLGLVAALALSACSAGGDATTATPSPSGKAMVTLSYQVPNGFAKVAAPSRSPQAGMSYDITTFEQDSSGCALQVMRVLMSSSNTMEDQDVTYTMVSGMATAQGVEDADHGPRLGAERLRELGAVDEQGPALDDVQRTGAADDPETGAGLRGGRGGSLADDVGAGVAGAAEHGDAGHGSSWVWWALRAGGYPHHRRVTLHAKVRTFR